MAIFSSAHLALRQSLVVAPRAASLGESLRQASDGHFTGRLLHGQLLLRCFTSDVFGPNKVFLPHPNSLHQFHPRCVRLIKGMVEISGFAVEEMLHASCPFLFSW